MKKVRFTETQIISILKQQEAGRSVRDIAREHGISDATFYNWKAKYGGMEANEIRRMKELEEENARLKRIVANQTLEIDAIKHVLEKSSAACRQTGSSEHDGHRQASECSSGLQNRISAAFRVQIPPKTKG
jgi:Transposase.